MSGDGFNDNPASATVTAYTPLIAPTQLTLTPNGPTEMDLSWNNISQTATGYEIQRRIAGGSWTTIGTVDYADTTYYSDTTPALATQYSYQVLATDGVGNYSAPSNVVASVTGPTLGTGGITAASIAEVGSTVTLETPVTYASGEVDPVTGWTIDWGDGTTPATEIGDPGSFTYAYSSPGSYTITATSADGSIGGSATTMVNYDYVAGSGSITWADDSGDTYVAGSNYGVTVDFAGDAGVHVSQWTAHWGDGAVQTIPISSPGDATDTYDFNHVFAYVDDVEAGYNVTIAAEATNGVVYQATPVVDVTGASPSSPDPAPVAIGTLNDGNSVPVQFSALPSGSSAVTYTIDFGDGSTAVATLVDSSGPSTLYYHQYPNPGDYIVTTTGSDGTESTQEIDVMAIAPVITAIPDQVVSQAATLNFSTAVSGLCADALATVDWSDGTGVHPAQLTDNLDGTGTISAMFYGAAPGTYTPTITLYLPGAAEHGGFGEGDPTSSVAISFNVYVWGIVINGGQPNDLLIASSDGTQNLQTATLYFPHPAGEAIDLTLTSSDNSEDDVWDASETGPTGDPGALVLGTDSSGTVVSSDSFSEDPSVSSKTLLIGATAGDTTANVFSLSLSGSADSGASTSTFNSEVAAGSFGDTGATGCEGPADQGSDLDVRMELESNPNGAAGASDVSNSGQHWLVGQVVDLKAIVDGPPEFLPDLHYSWGNLPGNTLVDYASSNLKSSTTPLAAHNTAVYGTDQQEVKFFWVSTTALAGDVDDVTVNVTGKSFDGRMARGSATTTFDVLDPSAPMTVADMGTVNVDLGAQAGAIKLSHVADFVLPGNDQALQGIAISGNVTIPAVFGNPPGQGQWKFVQTGQFIYQLTKYQNGGLINGVLHYAGAGDSFVVPQDLGSRGGTALDLADPYAILDGKDYREPGAGPVPLLQTGSGDHTMWDSPSTGLYEGPARGNFITTFVSRLSLFETYIMFKAPGGVWVPVAETNWGVSWNAELPDAVNLAHPGPLNNLPYAITEKTGPNPTDPTYINLDEPIWTSNQYNNEHPVPAAR